MRVLTAAERWAALLDLARDVLEGNSRSYVQDARELARWVRTDGKELLANPRA